MAAITDSTPLDHKTMVAFRTDPYFCEVYYDDDFDQLALAINGADGAYPVHLELEIPLGTTLGEVKQMASQLRDFYVPLNCGIFTTAPGKDQ